MATRLTIHFKCDGNRQGCSRETWVDVDGVQPAVPVDSEGHLPEGWTQDPDGTTYCPNHGGG